MTGSITRAVLALTIAATAASGIGTVPARADKIANRMAVFAFLDKVTARISKKAVPLNQTVLFGTLRVTPRACYTRPLTEEPKTTSFVEVQDQKLDGHFEPLFSGWMLAQSPGLHAVEHPVYDVWLTDCDKPGKVAAVAAAPDQPTPAKPAKAAAAAAPAASAADVFPEAAPNLDPALDPNSTDPAALEAQPGDATQVPDVLPLKKHRPKRQ